MLSTTRHVLLIRPVMNSYSPPQAYFECLAFSIGLSIKRQVLTTPYRVIDLHADGATKEAFEQAFALYPNIALITFLGHGHKTGTQVMGHNKLPVVDISNIHFAQDRGLVFLCCHAAIKLGHAALAAGARFFLGFYGKFYLFPYGAEPIVSDWAISGLNQILNGASPRDAFQAMRNEAKRLIQELETRQDELDPNWFLASTVLRANLVNLLCILP